MILRRNGNKQQIAHLIIPHFPEHKIYIEPFFGAGGMYFNKPKAKYNFLNDLDDDVFNLFIIDNAKQRGLNVITIGERRNLKNRRTEILITNYEPTAQQSLFN